MSIPYKMRPTGFDSWYVRLYRDLLQLLGSPAKFELAWIASEKKLIIHTDRVDDTVLTEVAAIAATLVPIEVDIVQYNHHIEVSWKDINKYAECRNQSDMLAINPNFGADLTSDGEWIYPMTSYVGQPDRFFPYNVNEFGDQRRYVKILHFNAPVLIRQGFLFQNCLNLKEAYLHMPALINNNELIRQNNKLEVLHLNAAKGTSFRLLCWGNRALREVKLYCPAAKDFSGAFNECRLPGAAVTDIINALPPWSDGEEHLLTLGIAVDLQNDEDVWTAIHDAEAKGWTLTVEWNPGGPVYTTPTA